MAHTKKQNKPIYLSVIIPAYNESGRIGKTLTDVTDFLAKERYKSEIIVVDDGSTDGLKKVVGGFIEKMPTIKLIRYAKNRGKGYAVKIGMINASGKYRLFMDADNSVTIDHVTKFLEQATTGYDVVVGSILLPYARDAVEMNGWHRVFLRHITKFVRSLVVDIDVYDTQRGFKLFSEEAALKLFTLQKVNRFGFDVELLALAKAAQYRIKEISVRWINPTGSKVTPLSYLQSFVELLSVRLNMFLGRYDF